MLKIWNSSEIKNWETYSHPLKDYNQEIQWFGARNKNNWITCNKLNLMVSKVRIVKAEAKEAWLLGQTVDLEVTMSKKLILLETFFLFSKELKAN